MASPFYIIVHFILFPEKMIFCLSYNIRFTSRYFFAQIHIFFFTKSSSKYKQQMLRFGNGPWYNTWQNSEVAAKSLRFSNGTHFDSSAIMALLFLLLLCVGRYKLIWRRWSLSSHFADPLVWSWLMLTLENSSLLPSN